MAFDEEPLEDSDSESHTKTSSVDDVADEDGEERSGRVLSTLGWFSQLLGKRNELSQWSTMWLKVLLGIGKLTG
jgi:hypothetical protein